MLVEHGLDKSYAHEVLHIVEHVSYSHELKNPQAVQEAIITHPELAVVQDADRLDAIGAIGIGRVFTYGAAKAPERGIHGSVQHFVDKLENLEGLMKVKRLRRHFMRRLTKS